MATDATGEMMKTTLSSMKQAARAWAATALPDARVLGADEDIVGAAHRLEAFWWDEAQKIGEGAPAGVHDDDWRAECLEALVIRIRESRRRADVGDRVEIPGGMGPLVGTVEAHEGRDDAGDAVVSVRLDDGTLVHRTAEQIRRL